MLAILKQLFQPSNQKKKNLFFSPPQKKKRVILLKKQLGFPPPGRGTFSKLSKHFGLFPGGGPFFSKIPERKKGRKGRKRAKFLPLRFFFHFVAAGSKNCSSNPGGPRSVFIFHGGGLQKQKKNFLLGPSIRQSPNLYFYFRPRGPPPPKTTNEGFGAHTLKKGALRINLSNSFFRPTSHRFAFSSATGGDDPGSRQGRWVSPRARGGPWGPGRKTALRPKKKQAPDRRPPGPGNKKKWVDHF